MDSDNHKYSSASTPIDEQVVLILVGLVGSGKSTFANALQAHFPQFVRCNQDELGNRRAVEAVARQTLARGKSVCIDRTNFDAQQRETWIRLARGYNTKACVLIFDTPYDVCASRLQTRTSHPTLPTPSLAISVLERFSTQFRSPHPSEGYDSLVFVKPEDAGAGCWGRDEVVLVLERLRQQLK